jgi:cell division protein FtsZ
MGIGIATGENRAAEAAKKAISSPLLETSIDGAQGVLMNITGGTNLSLYEVQESADIVASASDQEVNMIFGSVINESLKDEIVVTVIATGFDDSNLTKAAQQSRPPLSQKYEREQPKREPLKREPAPKREEQPTSQQEYSRPSSQPSQSDDALDIPTFLRNRNRRR